jgi:iron complex transport system substrate-binding protein
MPVLLLLLLLTSLLSGMASAQDGVAATAPALPQSTITVTDDTGRRVRLAAAARRIVTLSPHATELVYAAGAGDYLVAVAPYSDFPPAAAQLPSIGGLGGLDRERLLALNPDLVVAWDSGNRPADLAWLDSLGIGVYRSEPRALDDIARNLLDLGTLAGTHGTAQRAAASYRQSLRSACPGGMSDLSVFIQLSAQPLLTVGGGHWLDRAVHRTGLHNIYAELPGRAVVVSHESLLARRPAMVVYLAYPGAAAVADIAGGKGAATRPRVIGLNPKLWARPGPRLPVGIAQLCHTLHTPLPHNR